jgi:phage gp29-like protein
VNIHWNKIWTWRQQYNPLRGFTLTRLINFFENAERGWYPDLMWLYRFVEKREPTLRAIKRRMMAAVKKLDYEFVISDRARTPEMQAVAQVQLARVKEWFEQIQNVKEAVGHLVLASFRGFAHLEKYYFNDNPADGIYRLEPVPQWHWVRKWPSRAWLYNARADQTLNGIAIPEDKFVIREVEDPINEIASIAYLRKNMSQKDWDAFVETYGIPPLFIEMPEQTPNDLRAEFQDVAERVIGDGRGTLPFGAKVQTVKDGERGTNPFKDHVDYQDSQIVLAGTSGKLTVLNDPTGLGSGQSEVHAETFNDLAVAEAEEISEIMQSQLIEPFVLSDVSNPGAQIYGALVYFKLKAEERVQVDKLVDNVVKLEGVGYETEPEQIAEQTGLRLKRALVKPGMAGPNGGVPTGAGFNPAAARLFGNRLTRRQAEEADESLHRNLMALASQAQDAELAAIRQRLDAIKQIADLDLRNRKLRELRSQLPRLLADVNRDPALASVIEQSMTAAYFNGLEELAGEMVQTSRAHTKAIENAAKKKRRFKVKRDAKGELSAVEEE